MAAHDRQDDRYDVIVVGLGAFGSAAAYWGARRGLRVLGLERYELGHARGASEDHSRIVRRSYASADYVRFTAEAFAAWDELAREAGEQLITLTGGLDLFPDDPWDDPADYRAAMDAEGVPYEVLDADEVMRRWPQWRVPDGITAISQADAGVIAASRANEAHRRLARARGADLMAETRVLGIAEDPSLGFTVETSRGVFHADALVVTADSWTNEVLAPLGVSLPLRLLQEQVTYFDAADPVAFEPAAFPVWIWHRTPPVYGLPAFGRPGPKVALHGGGPEVMPESRTFEPDPGYAAVVERFVREHLPTAYGPPVEVRTCMYALTPDEDFVLDLIPGFERASLAIGTGHGFKFASVFGRTLIELAYDGASPWRLPAFAADRVALAP
jgi:sarcosine oxidase